MKSPVSSIAGVLWSRIAGLRHARGAAWALCGLAALLAVPKPASAQPANDSLLEAREISGASGFASGSNLDATKEAGEPEHAGNAGGASVWFAWTAPANGVVTFDTLDSDFDTLLAAYAGTAFANLRVLDFDDNIALDVVQSGIVFGARAGVRYLIAVDGYEGEQGAVELYWSLEPPPANDRFATPHDIEGAAGVHIGVNLGATKEPGEPDHAFNAGNASVWLRWTAPASGLVAMSTANSLTRIGVPMDTLLGVYTGESVDALALIATNDNLSISSTRSLVAFNAVHGTTYRIAVDGADRGTNVFQGEVVLAWAMFPPPTNNAFATARNLDGDCGTVAAHNIAATKESGEPDHAGAPGGSSVWFNWTALADGPAVFTTSISPYFDSLLAVYTGDAVDALALVASNHNISFSFNSRVEFTATAGATYRIAVDGTNNTEYPFTLSWGLNAPPNNEFIDAFAFNTATGSTQGCTFNATKDFAEPDHAGNVGGKSVWYVWTPPISGVATLDLAGSSFDTLLGVYTGPSVDALTLVADNDDAGPGNIQSRVRFVAEAAVDYYIAVDGYDAEDGIVRMSWNLAAPPVLQISRDGANVTLTWAGPYRIESADALDDPTVWSPVAGASPLTLPADPAARFFRAVFP